MTDYYSNGKRLSAKDFKSRIKKAEEDIKEGRFYTADKMKAKMEKWIDREKLSSNLALSFRICVAKCV